MSEDFSGNFYENLRSLITLVDHLRDAGLQKYIKLPRIVTLGTQSSGKSSVLENIVGLNFLPRGEGVCTRRPLELRLVHTFDNSPPWAKFEDMGEQKFTNFDDVRRGIERLTDEVAGTRKAIIDNPIVLTVYSCSCPDLTLIDLPGITRIPVGDQPQDIERITKEMAYKYVSDPRTIILCVIPINQDISTSEALQMAKRVDPQGIRTLGVLTKIDIMDKGTDAKKNLLGQDVPLRLGYVGIKNRSQHAIINKVTVENALKDERDYFASHPTYSTMPPGYLGTDVLVEKLTRIMFTHIKRFLPDILKEVVLRLHECEEKLSELGPEAPVEPKQKVQLLWNMVTDFLEIYKNLIRGKYDRKRSSRITKGLTQGTDIKLIFRNLLINFTGEYRATANYSEEEIQKAITMHEGDSIPGFPSVDAFIYLIQPQLELLKEPVMECMMSVYSHLETLAHTIIERVFYRFPPIVGELSEVATGVLVTERESCRDIVEKMMDADESYIFTNDMDYLLSRSDLIPKQASGAKMDARTLFVEEIRVRIDSYFRLVARNVRDSAPKLIGFFLVRSSMDRLQYELYNYLNANDRILECMSEPENITKEREVLRKQLETLRKAQKIIKLDPHLAAQSENFEEEIKLQEEDLVRKKEESKRKDEEKRAKEEAKRREEEKRAKEEPRREDAKAAEVPKAEPKKDPSNSMFDLPPAPPSRLAEDPSKKAGAKKASLFS